MPTALSIFVLYNVYVGQKEDLKNLETRFLEGKFTPFSEDAERVPLMSTENVEGQPAKKKQKGKYFLTFQS